MSLGQAQGTKDMKQSLQRNVAFFKYKTLYFSEYICGFSGGVDCPALQVPLSP